MFRRRVLLSPLVTATLWMFWAISGFAADTEIYTSSGEGVEPNVLIIFDNSGSMNEEIQVSFYDPGTLYPNHLGIDPNAVYYYASGSWDNVFQTSTADIPCDRARNALNTWGFFNGRIGWDGNCSGRRTRYLRTGNYRNYLVEIGGIETRPKLDIAKEVVQDFVMTTYGIRMGAMVFNHSEGGRIHYDSGLDYYTHVQDMGKDDLDPQYANRVALKDALVSISADTWTPLAETLYEVGLYFKGEASHFNSGVTYASPITHWCQKNYVIIITDGQSTQDRNAILTTLGTDGDVDGDTNEPGTYPDEGSDYLDDVAKYLYDTDLSPLREKQNLVTYTIGFAIDTQLLQDTAENGHGKYYTSNNARELSQVFQRIIQEILETSSSFTAPVVPISQMEKATSGSKIYLALFKPSQEAFWKGNIKKFAIATEETAELHRGDIIDANGNRATDDEGHILDTAVSFWGTEADGGETERGGVGQVLLDRTTPRNLYTYLGITTDLTHPANAFNNTNISPDAAGLGGDTVERDRIVSFVHGFDVYDEDGDSDTAEKRHWILGSFLHSRPTVVHYDPSTSVVFAGANDGMLHAFLDSDGSELWGFIPPDALARLKTLNGTVHEYFVDGAPRAAVIDSNGNGTIEPSFPENDRVILVFGERRGGSHYYALDVTYPDYPVLLWDISPGLGDFLEMGQSWATPAIGRIAHNDKLVVFLSGGYDTNQDDDPAVASDTMGRGLYVVDLFDGALVWDYTNDDNPAMASCIPSDVVAIDVNNDPKGYVDRLYVGDIGGRMWRFNISDSDPANWKATMIFDDSRSGRKIFYPPDVVLEQGFEMLFWGTGDRANPKNESIINRIYALKDRNPADPFTEADLVDVTANLIQDGTDLEKANTRDALDSHDGWYVELNENTGEKVLAPSIVYFGVVYLTTFTPTRGVTTDPCYVGEGTARLYALDYKTAAAVLDFDTTSDELEKTDRSKIIGTAIPSGMVIAIIQGKGSSYIGVGGGIATSDMVNPAALSRIYWRSLSP